MTRVLLVYPKEQVSGFTATRMWESLSRYFAGDEFVKSRAAPRESLPHYAGLLGGDVMPLSRQLMDANDILVVAADFLSECAPPDEKRIYRIGHDHAATIIRLANQELSALDWPHIDAHSFNKLGSSLTTEQFEFFPYGITFRDCLGAAPNNAFGFRIAHDLAALAPDRRSPHDRVIVLLGGSAAWSWYAFHEESFAFLLEQRLQAAREAAGLAGRIYVLNFAQGGSVVLHEMIVYLLHCESLRPDLVITHDGFNDLGWGLTADLYLLERQICVPHIFEQWAARLHRPAGAELRFKPGENPQPFNLPQPIIDAYVGRKLQLARLIESAGAHHIFAVQPWIQSKAELSSFERDKLAESRGDRRFDRMPHLYRALADTLAGAPSLLIAYLHAHFGQFGADETLFQDIVHTTPDGETKIAEFYCDYIAANSDLAARILG